MAEVPAWDELVKDAWDETIPATYKTIHHDAVYETVTIVDTPETVIEHEAVTCPAPEPTPTEPPTTIGTPETPDTARVHQNGLAETGGALPWLALILGAGALGTGVIVTVRKHSKGRS